VDTEATITFSLGVAAEIITAEVHIIIEEMEIIIEVMQTTTVAEVTTTVAEETTIAAGVITIAAGVITIAAGVITTVVVVIATVVVVIATVVEEITTAVEATRKTISAKVKIPVIEDEAKTIVEGEIIEVTTIAGEEMLKPLVSHQTKNFSSLIKIKQAEGEEEVTIIAKKEEEAVVHEVAMKTGNEVATVVELIGVTTTTDNNAETGRIK